jgi:ATP-dependent RNA circularization protein (DNA/RNA ligase family)
MNVLLTQYKSEYHKIPSIFKRNLETKKFIFGQFTSPELEFLANADIWYATEKIDGTNIRIICDISDKTGPDSVSIQFLGRHDNGQIQQPLIGRLSLLFANRQLDFLNKFKCGHIVLYGEGYGHGIQKYGDLYKQNDVGFILFDVKVDGWWLRRKDVINIAEFFGIPYVPTLFIGTLNRIVDEMVATKADQIESLVSECPRPIEGLVIRPKEELFTRGKHRIITKIKYSDI